MYYFAIISQKTTIRFIYHETAGGHEWKNWKAYLMTFLPLLFNDLPNEIDASYEELEENYADEEL